MLLMSSIPKNIGTKSKTPEGKLSIIVSIALVIHKQRIYGLATAGFLGYLAGNFYTSPIAQGITISAIISFIDFTFRLAPLI